MTDPEFPAGVIFQSIAIDPEGKRSGYRIEKTGRYLVKDPTADAWTEVMVLTADQLNEVVDLLDGTTGDLWQGSFGEYRKDPPQTVTWIQFLRQGDPLSLCLFSGYDQPDFVSDLLMRLTTAFQK